jgi:hypothetical protein
MTRSGKWEQDDRVIDWTRRITFVFRNTSILDHKGSALFSPWGVLHFGSCTAPILNVACQPRLAASSLQPTPRTASRLYVIPPQKYSSSEVC